jgi:hypothetical protein
LEIAPAMVEYECLNVLGQRAAEAPFPADVVHEIGVWLGCW